MHASGVMIEVLSSASANARGQSALSQKDTCRVVKCALLRAAGTGEQTLHYEILVQPHVDGHSSHSPRSMFRDLVRKLHDWRRREIAVVPHTDCEGAVKCSETDISAGSTGVAKVSG